METDGGYIVDKNSIRGLSMGEYAVQPADPKAVEIIENLYGEK